MSAVYRLSRAWFALMRWWCERVGHDWSAWEYSETPEVEFARHRHHDCARCGTSSGDSGLVAFPVGAWVRRDHCSPPDHLGVSRIIGIEYRLVTEETR